MDRPEFPENEKHIPDPDMDYSQWGHPIDMLQILPLPDQDLEVRGMRRLSSEKSSFDINAARTFGYEGATPGPYVAGTADLHHGVIEINNPVMMLPNGIMALPDINSLIAESCWQTAIGQHPALRGNRSTKGKWHTNMDFFGDSICDAGPVLHCYHRFNFQYFHWFIDCLPRVWLAQKLDLESMPILLGDIKPGSPQHKSLQQLGIDEEQFYFPPARNMRFSKAICPFSSLKESLHVRPSFQDGQHYKGGWDPVYLAWLGDMMRHSFADTPVETGSRIYVDRSQSNHRRLANADQFHDFLRKNNFDFVDPGQHSFEQQVAMFSKAEIVVGPHGAGMSNLMWCDPAKEVCVIEVGIQSVYDTGYTFISSALGFTHDVLFANPLPHFHGPAFADLDVDIDQLIALVQERL